jgi:hypothetical protein
VSYQDVPEMPQMSLFSYGSDWNVQTSGNNNKKRLHQSAELSFIKRSIFLDIMLYSTRPRRYNSSQPML